MPSMRSETRRRKAACATTTPEFAFALALVDDFGEIIYFAWATITREFAFALALVDDFGEIIYFAWATITR